MCSPEDLRELGSPLMHHPRLYINNPKLGDSMMCLLYLPSLLSLRALSAMRFAASEPGFSSSQ